MMMESCLFLLVNIGMLAGAYLTACRLYRARLELDVFTAAVLIYFAQITVSVLFLGVVVQKLTVFTLIALNSGLVLLEFLAFRRNYQPLWPFFKKVWSGLTEEKSYWLYLVLSLLLLEIGILLWKVIYFPPHVYDVLTYHLTPAVEWYQQERIPAIISTGVARINSMALGMTVLSYWAFLLARNDCLVELPQLVWALLLIPVAYSTLRKTALPRVWAFEFAVLVFFIPFILMQSTTAKDQIGLTVAFLAGLLFLYDFYGCRDHTRLIMAGIAFGLMSGYKLVGVAYLGICGLIFLGLLWAAPEKPLADRDERRRFVKSLVAMAGIVLALSGYWYIKNFAIHGRMQGGVKIAMFQLGQGNFWSEILFRWGLVKANVLNFMPRVMDVAHPYHPSLPDISGFGPQFMAFGITAMVIALFTWLDKKYRFHPFQLFVASAFALLAFYFSLYYSPYNYRLFVFFPVIMIMLAAAAFHSLGVLTDPWGGRIVHAVILSCLLWCGLTTLPLFELDISLTRDAMTMPQEKRCTANLSVYTANDHLPYRWIATWLPPEEPLAYFGHEDSWSYVYYDIHWRRKLMFVDPKIYCTNFTNCIQVCRSKPQLKAFLQANNIRFLCTSINSVNFRLEDRAFSKVREGLYYCQPPQEERP